ncbi:DUF1045 domain-containing protein [Pelagibius sp.]|uniref:DUF1045 domain-containing protein n=1 Tax=Pelagibius sp. TaxID=1931238 RepID=UPI003BB006DE
MSQDHLPRYAVYYALPRRNALWALAQDWLGRDCETGRLRTPPKLEGWTAAELAAATESPRHYGFHATLKAPFHLSPDCTLQQLRSSLSRFALDQPSFTAPPLKVSAIGPFLALTFSEPAPAMETLAAEAVRDLDVLRAPLSEESVQRRLAKGLTPRQEALLRRWGYPYVFEEFRFHMTLTGPLADRQKRERLQEALAEYLASALDQPTPVQEISLYSQADTHSPFMLEERFSLGVRDREEAADAESSDRGQAAL